MVEKKSGTFKNLLLPRIDSDTSSEVQKIHIPDGRTISLATYGDPKRKPVFWLHGTPGSRIVPVLTIPVGINLIAYDRPGYGFSTRKEGRTIADAAEDVKAIADELGIETFTVVGSSGGGGPALACAALLPDRVEEVVVIAGPAPPNAEGLDWDKGMMEFNVQAFTNAATESGHTQLMIDLQEQMEVLQNDPARFMKDPNITDADKERIEHHMPNTIASNTERYRQGVVGWFDDILATRYRMWGFDLSDITVPVSIFHGEKDEAVPVSHATWLANHLPEAKVTLKIAPNKPHYYTQTALSEVLTRVASSHS
jgi:pimeloyl-ACP methyl ester carboxylesterase